MKNFMNNQMIKKERDYKKLGLILIVAPFAGIILILLSYTIVTFITAALDVNSTTSTAAVSIINFILGLLGLLAVLSLFVCIPLGIIYLNKSSDNLSEYDERSGKGRESEIPAEIKKWNWGAAGIGLIWGLYHRVWLSLLVFIPILNLVWWIALGIHGNEWAWKKNKWKNVAAFKRSQNKWRPWGIASFIIGILITIIQIGSIVENETNFSNEKYQEATVQGSKVDYTIRYDKNKWKVERGDLEDENEYFFSLKGEEAYAMIIPERTEIPIKTLKRIALENAQNIAPDTTITEEAINNVNGINMLTMQMKGIIEEIPFQYYGHYYVGDIGTIQFIGYTSQKLFPEYEQDIEEILNGLEVGEASNIDETALIKIYDDESMDSNLSYENQIIIKADYNEGYKSGYADGRAIGGSMGDGYNPPATEERKDAYSSGYFEGFLKGCREGNFEGCDEIEAQINEEVEGGLENKEST